MVNIFFGGECTYSMYTISYVQNFSGWHEQENLVKNVVISLVMTTFC